MTPYMNIKYRISGERFYREVRCYKYEFTFFPNGRDGYVLIWTLEGTKYVTDVEHMIVEIVNE